MNKLARFNGYGIEDGEVAEIDSDLPEVETEEGEDLQEDLVESQTLQADADADATAGDIAEMSDVAESLEAICLGIESTLRYGGLNRQAAAFALQSADMQLARIGMNGVDAVSVEDFLADAADGTNGGSEVDDGSPVGLEPDSAPNAGISQEAATSIKEKIMAILRAIGNAIKSFFAKVKDFFNRILDMLKLVERKAKALKEKLGKMKNTKAKDTQVDIGDLAEKLALNGKLAAPAEIKNMGAMTGFDPKKSADALTKAKTRAVERVMKTNNIEKVAEEALGVVKEVAGGLMAGGFIAAAGGETNKKKLGTTTMIGNRTFYVTLGSDASNPTALNVSDLEEVKSAKDAPKKMKVLTIEEMKSYVDAVLECDKMAVSIRQNLGMNEKTTDAALKSLEGMSSKAKEGIEGRLIQEAARASAKIVHNAAIANTQINRVVAKQMTAVCKDTLRLVTVHMGEYYDVEKVKAPKATKVAETK